MFYSLHKLVQSNETYGFWDENFINNIKLSHHLMSLAKERKFKRVIFASSYLIYSPLHQFSKPSTTHIFCQKMIL